MKLTKQKPEVDVWGAVLALLTEIAYLQGWHDPRTVAEEILAAHAHEVVTAESARTIINDIRSRYRES